MAKEIELKCNLLIDQAARQGFLPYYGFTGNLIQIIFLKYLSIHEFELDDLDDYKILSNYQRGLNIGCIEFDVVADVYKMISKLYKQDETLLSFSLEGLRTLIQNNYKEILNLFTYIDFLGSKDDIKEAISYILFKTENRDISKSALHSSNDSLVELASRILDVKNNESFMDNFSGFGKMMMEVEADNYTGYELVASVAGISIMINIMLDRKKFIIVGRDYYETPHQPRYDKIFCDAPISLTMREWANDTYKLGKKSDPYSILFSNMDLNEGGKAVVTTVGNVLFSVQNSYVEFRKKILKDLVAVIALPSLWAGTMATTNLLVFEKGSNRDKILMCDASKLGNSNKAYRQVELSNDEINKIMEAMEFKNINGFSKVVNKSEISNEECFLTPGRYLEVEEKISYRKVEEIDKELKDWYEKLSSFMK